MSFTPATLLATPRRQHAAALVGLTFLGLGAHLLWSELVDLFHVCALVLGTYLGLAMGGRQRPTRLGQDAHATQVIVADISSLRQAFAVLQQQVKATIHTSETAVMSMMDRMNRVYRNSVALKEKVVDAVGHSQSLSSESLDRAAEHGRAVSRLAEHQLAFEKAQRENQERVRAVAEQVRQLTPLAALIADISRQTNLLAINASIEAARAGQEGAGFKVVAAEVRRLSSQTAEAARQIGDGIHQAAQAIDAQRAAAKAMEGDGAAAELGEIANHIERMSTTLGHVVPYLSDLSRHMDMGMEDVTIDIIDTLGDMQFQDINRQLLDQINHALGSLSDHFSQIYALIDGEAPPPPVMLEELMSLWTQNYVMHSQRVAHAQALGHAQAADVGVDEAIRGGDGAEVLTLAPAHGPRIELF